MGYTHYWRPQRDFTLSEWENITTQFKSVIDNAGITTTDDVKYSIRPYSIGNEGIVFNGVGNEGHETFWMSREKQSDFEFCKTAHKPYDALVTACLTICKSVAPDALDISSDGDMDSDWQAGRDLIDKYVIGKTPKPTGATITLADVHGAIETYEVQNTLFMQIWDLLHAAGCNKLDKLTLPEVMVVKNKDYGMPGYINPDSRGFKQIDPGLQVRSSRDDLIAPVVDEQDTPATPLPETEEIPAEDTTGSQATPSGAVSDMDFMSSLAKLMSKTK